MVQTVATVLMTYKQRPSLGDCALVAKSLIERHPFLADCDGTGEVCWYTKIYKIMYNIHAQF